VTTQLIKQITTPIKQQIINYTRTKDTDAVSIG
jgi:hypothetical protein